jgi:AraC family transcriptional regulator
MERARTDVRQWPGMRSEYSWIEPGEVPGGTGPHQAGVSFSQHHAAVYELAGRTVEADIGGGSVFVTGAGPITWTRIRETTEAVEVYPDRGLLRELAPGEREFRPAAGARDGTVLAICSVLKRAHATGGGLTDIAASTLAHRLARHLLVHYAGGQVARERGPARLDRATVDRVTELVDAELPGQLTLDRLAAVALLSPFHFARAFKATTGLAPHEFVTARRMHRATAMLLSTPTSVPDVAHAVGLSNVSHFRRLFRRQMGVSPGALRQQAHDQAPRQERKIGPCARASGM